MYSQDLPQNCDELNKPVNGLQFGRYFFSFCAGNFNQESKKYVSSNDIHTISRRQI
jgi:hypothetical protein